MVDFNKKVLNSDKFRLAAIYYQEHGYYTAAPEGTTDYYNYWKREADRCLNGYTAPDGDEITGYHYFYLNYSPIMKQVDTEYTDRHGNKRTRRERLFKFPNFWDYDYYYFNAIEEAELEGKHMVVLKARQRGYSFKGASMLCRNYFLIPKSKNFAVASELKYLTGDGLLTKAWQIMDFLDKHSGWAKRRLKATALERTSGFKVKDEITGKETEDGYLSSITGITLKNDPERLRGTRGRLVLFEEAGKFPDITTAWLIERPAVETDDGVAFGLLIAFGTGGEVGADFEGLQNMFYHPDGFNCLGFPNIWDEGMADQKCGFFVPAWSNMETAGDKDPCMDKDGNTIKENAMHILMELRMRVRDGQDDETIVDRYVAEHPNTPLEAVLEIGTNIFPKKQLLMLLSKLRTNTKMGNMKHIVDLVWKGDGTVEAVEKKTGDITNYPLKEGLKPEGSVVIFEYPIKDPPFGLYIAGCLTPGEKVCTLRGLVNVEDVTLDDKLVNKDGKFVEIKNLLRYEKEDEPIFKIKPYGSFRTTTFTGEHPIWVHNKGFVKAKYLKEGDWLEIPNRYKFDGMGFLDDKLLKLYYFYGLWLGDGFCNKNGNSYDIYLSIGKDEEELALFYDSLVLELFGRKCIHVHKDRELTRRFTNKELFLKLKSMFGANAYNKRIPESIKHLPHNYKRAFLQGYLDSDGSVFLDKGKVRVNFTSVNLKLLEDVQDMLFGMDIANSIVIHQKERTNKQGIHSELSYRINVSRCDQYWLKYGPVFRSRKIKLLEKSFAIGSSKMGIKFEDDKILLKVEKISKSSYTGIVYNFECETHTFMCRNILTHNCDPLNVSGV